MTIIDTAKIEEGHNFLMISLSGDQSFVKIFDASDKLIRHSRTPGATKIQHRAAPGEYKVETDGTINQLRSAHIDLKENSFFSLLGENK